MSRPLKFRAWDKDNKVMRKICEVYWNTSGHFLKVVTDQNYLLYPKDIKMMQSTSLKDKNGVEIYEGDVITCDTDGRGDNWKATVSWDKELSGFYPFCDQVLSAPDAYSEWSIHMTTVEVIGNMYENPELLKAKP